MGIPREAGKEYRSDYHGPEVLWTDECGTDNSAGKMSQEQQKSGNFTPENIDPFLFSNFIYLFASLSNMKIIIKDRNGGHVIRPHPGDDEGICCGYWIYKGNAKKVVMGIPMYRNSYTLASADTAIGASASGPGAAGPITKSSGILAYYEVCQFLQEARITRLYAVKGNQWVSYDDVENMETKVQFLKNLNLGGALITIDLDDFTGQSCHQGPYPLVQAVKRNLGSLGR
ncbi:LOW QUALITY PROTEIN: chitinase-3-like protein 2 [Erethizon dorsatum]